MTGCKAPRGLGVAVLWGLIAAWAGESASAATYIWSGASSASWGDSGNWGGTAPGGVDVGLFNSGSYSSQPSVAAAASVGGIWDTGGALTIGGSSALSLYGTTINGSTATEGIEVDAGAAALSISAPLVLAGSQSWLNNSSSLLTVSGNVVNGGFPLTLAGSGSTLLSGTLSGVGGLIQAGSGLSSFSGAGIKYSGPTTLSSGTLTLQDTTAFASAIAVGPNATLNLVRTVATFTNRSPIAASAITGSGVIDVNSPTSGIGGGWVIINGGTALNFTGTININSGVFSTDSGGGVQGSATVNVASGGILSIHNASAGWVIGALNGAGDVTPAQGTTGPTYNLTVGAANASGSFSGIVHGNNSVTTDGTIEAGYLALIKTGAGTQVLSGSNTYAGGTTLSGGTLVAANNSALGAGAITLSPTAAATLDFTTSAPSIISLATSGTGTSTVLLGNGAANTPTTLTISDTASANFGGLIGDLSLMAGSATGALVKTGTGTQTLSGTSSYTGGTTINGGDLVFSGTAALPTIGTVTINSGGAGGVSGTVTANSVLTRTSTASSGALAITAANNETLSFINYPSLSLGSIGANTYSGALTPSGTTYRLGGGGGTLTYTPALSGSNGLSLGAGPGTVVLTASNGFTGPTSVTTGSLVLGNLNAAQNSTVSVGVNNGLSFASGITAPAIGALSGSGNVSLQDASSNAVTLNAGGNGAITSYSGVLSGSGGLIKTGSGTLVLNGANTYAGITTISQGTLRTLSAPLANVQTNFSSFGTTVNGYQDNFSSGTLNSGWQFVANAAGSTNPFALVTSSTGSYLHVTTGSNDDPNHLLYEPSGLGTSNTWTVLALVQMNSNFTANSDPQRAGVGAGIATSTSRGVDELFRASGTQGGQNANGQGVAMLSDNVAWGPQVTPSPVNWTTGTKYWMELTETAGTQTAKFWPANGSTAESSASTVTWTQAGTTGFAGLTAGSNGGALDMNVYYALIQNSQLPAITAGVGGETLPSTTTMAIASGATWDLAGSMQTVAGLSGVSGGYGSITLGASGTLMVTATGASTFGGPISDSGGGSLVIGGGTLTLTGSDSYSGGTTINAGALVFSGSAALPASGKITINANGAAGGSGGVTANNVLALASTASAGALAITAANNETLNFANYPSLSLGSVGNNIYSGTLMPSGSAYQLGGGGGTLIYSPAISGTASLVLGAGPGTVDLTASNNYTGPTTVTTGSLMLGNLNAVQNSTVNVAVNNGLSFAAGIDAPAIGGLSGSGSVSLQDASSNAVTLSLGGNNANTTYSGMLSGGGGLITTSTGMLTLGGSSTYGGGTTISSGTLVAANNGALGTGPVTMSPAVAATLAFTTAAPIIGSLGTSGNGTSTVLLGNGPANTPTALTVNTATATTFGGTIGDLSLTATNAKGSLIVTGSGILTLVGTSSYSGGTTISGGDLVFGAAPALPSSGAITINTGGAAGGSGPVTANGVLALTSTASTGALAITAANSESLNFGGAPNYPNLSLGSIGNNTYSGALTPSGTTYRLGGGGGTLTFPAALNGNNGLTLGAGPGTVVLTNNNYYVGPTVISTGTLQLGNGLSGQDGSIVNTSAVTNNSALAYNLNGTQNPTYAISGSGSLIKAGPGILLLTTSAAYSGPTVISGGTLQLGSGVSGYDGSIASSSVTNNSALIFNLAGSQTAAYAITGSGGLTMSGGGTLLLTGSNTYSGPTVINGGTLKLQQGFRYYEFSVSTVQGGGTNILQISEFGLYSSGSNPTNGTRVIPANGISAYTGTFAAGEGPTGLYDNNTNTKWCDLTAPTTAAPATAVFDFGACKILTGYDWATANDTTPARNPNNWQVLGSNNGTTWTVLDTETGQGNNPTSTFTYAGGWAFSASAEPVGFLPSATALSIAANSTFDLDGGSQQVASLNGGGSIINSLTGSTSPLILNPAGGSNTFSGVIAGSGTLGIVSLAINGAGTHVFTGSNTYTGATSIGGGTLQLGTGASGQDGSIASTSGVTNNSALVYNLYGNQAPAYAISGSGSLTKLGAGMLTLGGANSYSGGTTISAGTLALSGGNNRLSSSGGITVAGGVLDLGGSGQTTTGAVSFQGGTVQNGTLTNNGVNYNGQSGLVTAVLAGSAGLTMSGPGTLTLATSSTYSGPTVINGGTLKLQSGFRYYEFQVNQAQAGYNNIFQISELAFYSTGTNNTNGSRVIPANGVLSYTGAYNTGEGPTTIYDNNVNTKWCDTTNITSTAPQSVVLDFGTSQLFTGYDWATANDSVTGRNPNNWQVLGSNNGTTWTPLDTETNQGTSPTTTFTYATGWAINTPGILPSGTLLSMAAGSTLDLNGCNQQVASLSDISGAGGSLINSMTGAGSILTLSPTGGSTTYSGVIAGGGTLGSLGLILNGPGVQVLAGSNTYSGPTTITAGTLAVNGSLAAASNVAISGTAASLAGSGLVGGNTTLAGNGVINLTGGTIGGTLGVSGGAWSGTGSVAGAIISSSGLFTIPAGASLNAINALGVSGGTLALGGVATAAGPTTVSGGLITVLGGGNLYANGGLVVTGGSLGGSGTITGSLNYTSSASDSFSGTIAGNGASVTLGNSAATLALGGINTYTGTTNVNAGALIVMGTHSGGDAYTIAAGATLAGVGTVSGTNTVNLNAGSFLAPGPSAMAGNVGTLTLPGLATSGSATLNFDLSSSPAGSNDLVQVKGPLTLNGSTTVVVNRTNGVLASGDYPLFNYTGSLTYASSATSLVLSPGALTTRQQAYFDYGTTVAGEVMLDVIGTPASLTWIGGTTSGTSGTFTNTWNQNVLSNTVWNDGANPNFFGSGDNVTFSATSSNNVVTLSGTLNPLTVTVSGSNSYTFSGPGKISSVASLTVQGGTLTLANSGGNDYTFGTYVNGGGLLALGINNGLPIAGALTLGSGGGSGTFDLAGLNQQLGGLAVGSGAAAASQVIGNSAVSSTSTLTFSGSASSSFGGTIQDGVNGSGGQLALTVAGGLLNLSGSNSYSGPTNISGGTLQLGSATALYAGAAVSNLAVNGVLDLAGNNASVAALTGTGSITSSAGGSMLLTAGGNNATSTFSGVLASGSGTVALTKTGSGDLTLAANSSYSGPTTINGGALSVGVLAASGSNSPLGSGSSLVFNGGVLQYTGTANSVDGAFNRGITLLSGGGTIDIGNPAGYVFVSGTISGSGALTKTGTRQLIIDGNNTYSGNTYINAGEIQLRNSNALGNGTGTTFVASGADLAIGGVANQVVNENISLNGMGYNGNGALQVNDAGITGTYAGMINLASTSGIGSATPVSFTISGPISGTGGLTKLSADVVTLTGSNSYTGLTAINAGTLQIGNGGSGESLNSTSGVVNNGSLAFNHADAMTFSPAISGSGTLTKAGSGITTLASANTYTGTTTISGGQLALGNSLAVQNSTVVVSANNGLGFAGGVDQPAIGGLSGNSNLSLQDASSGAVTLSVGGNNANTAYNGVLGGSGGLTKTGTGTLTLSANSTYSGTTMVNAGTLVLNGAVSGFGNTGTGWTLSGTAAVAANVLTLTNNLGGQVGAAFYNAKLPTGPFTASFIYTAAGNKAADGATFVLQNDSRGPSAIGGSGGALAYTGITPSAAIAFNLYNGVNGVPGTAYTSGGTNAQCTATSPVSFNSGDPIQVTLTYDGSSNLLETLYDMTSGSSYSKPYTGVNLASATGGGAAYLGFTGATGGQVATQTISSLSFVSNNLLPAGTPLQVAAGAAVDLDGTNQTVGALSGAGTLTNSNGNLVSTLSAGSGGASQTFSGLLTAGLSANLALSKIGSGTLTLTAANAYGGGTTVGGGTLQLGNAFALGTGGLTANSGVVDLAGFNSTVASLSGAAGTITNSSGSLATLTTTQNGTTTFSGTLQDGASPTGLAMTGTGTLVLANSNTFSGTVHVGNNSDVGQILLANSLALQNANLNDGNDNGIAFASNISSATLGSIGSVSRATQDLSLSNAASGAVTLVVGNNGNNGTFSGRFLDIGGIDKIGAGSLTLLGKSTNSGANTLDAGTLVMGNHSALGAGTLTLNGGTLAGSVSGGTIAGLVQGGSGPQTIAPGAGLTSGQYGILNLNGGLDTNSSTTLAYNLNLSSSIGGSLNSEPIYAGDLINLGAGGVTGSGSISIAGLGTAPADYRLFGGSVGASYGSLVLPTLAGDTVSLSTMVDSGYLDLVVASGAAFSGSATWNGTSNSWNTSANWLDGSNQNGVPGTSLSRTADTATFSGLGSVTAITLDASPNLAALSFSGANYTLTGSSLTLHNGSGTATVLVTSSTQTIASGLVLASSGSFQPDAASVLNLSGSISGGGALSLDGAGELVLSNPGNSYTGGTYVNSGTLVATVDGAIPAGSSLTVGAGASSLFASSLLPGVVAGAPREVVAVPEPGTVALLLAALWSAVIYYRFRRPKAFGVR